jgi:hypothetical protein
MSISTRIIDTPVSQVLPRRWQCKMADVVDVRSRLRVVTEFLTAEGSNPTEINRHRRNVCDDDATDVSSVRRWMRRFKSGGKVTDNRSRSGRLAMAATTDTKDKLMFFFGIVV